MPQSYRPLPLTLAISDLLGLVFALPVGIMSGVAIYCGSPYVFDWLFGIGWLVSWSEFTSRLVGSNVSGGIVNGILGLQQAFFGLALCLWLLVSRYRVAKSICAVVPIGVLAVSVQLYGLKSLSYHWPFLLLTLVVLTTCFAIGSRNSCLVERKVPSPYIEIPLWLTVATLVVASRPLYSNLIEALSEPLI